MPYGYHKAHILKKISERISDMVEFSPKQFNMRNMFSIGSTFHAAQDLIYVLYNPAPENPLAKLGSRHKDSLRTLAEIFGKAIPPAIPLRVSVREVVQEKPKEVNKENVQVDNASKENHLPMQNL